MDSPTARILVVDDEPRSLELLQRALRSVGQVETAQSGDEAWERVQRVSIDLVITDQRMPGLTGADLLAKIAQRDPLTARVLLTGYADLQATIDAINLGRLHAYVTKPWQPDELALTARSLIERIRLERQNVRLVSELTDRNAELEIAMAELRRAQTELVGRERLSAVGRMVAMVVHDFRSPLAVVVSTLAEMGRYGAGLPEETQDALRQAQDETRRMSEMCAELLDLSRVGDNSVEFVPQDLDDILYSAVAALSDEAGRAGVVVETDLGCDRPLLLDANSIRRAILNLARNSMEAMLDGGRLCITSAMDQSSAIVRVVDSGAGIPAEIEDELFEAFVTHGKPSGSGLGLAVVKTAVDSHGGEVSVSKAEGGGTAFEIRLPFERAPQR
jgi:signal transduction histidine kinase